MCACQKNVVQRIYDVYENMEKYSVERNFLLMPISIHCIVYSIYSLVIYFVYILHKT